MVFTLDAQQHASTALQPAYQSACMLVTLLAHHLARLHAHWLACVLT